MMRLTLAAIVVGGMMLAGCAYGPQHIVQIPCEKANPVLGDCLDHHTFPAKTMEQEFNQDRTECYQTRFYRMCMYNKGWINNEHWFYGRTFEKR